MNSNVYRIALAAMRKQAADTQWGGAAQQPKPVGQQGGVGDLSQHGPVLPLVNAVAQNMRNNFMANWKPGVSVGLATMPQTPMQKADLNARRWQAINKGLDWAYEGAEQLANLPKNIGKLLSPATPGGLVMKALIPGNVGATAGALRGVGSVGAAALLQRAANK